MTTCREGQLSDQIRQKTERIAFDRFCVLGACLEYTTLETRVCGALKSDDDDTKNNNNNNNSDNNNNNNKAYVQ